MADDVLLEFYAAKRKRWFFTDKITLPDTAPHRNYYTFHYNSAVNWDVSKVSRDDAIKQIGRNEKVSIIVVNTSAIHIEIAFSKLITDTKGYNWDLVLIGNSALIDIRSFLEMYGAHNLTPETPLSRALFESWVFSIIHDRVKDAVVGYSQDDLKEKNALPARWWNKQFNDWFSKYGLMFKIDSSAWESAGYKRAEEERVRICEMKRIEKDRKLQSVAEHRAAKLEEDHKADVARINADRQLSDLERNHKLQLHELRHSKERLAAETELNDARRASERAALEHEFSIAKLRNDIDAARIAKSHLETADTQNKTFQDILVKATDVLEKLGRTTEPLLQKITNLDSRVAHQTFERLISPEFGIPVEVLKALGYSSPNQMLMKVIKDKQVSDGQPLTISKSELRTRNIGTSRVKALSIGSSLQFNIISKRAGYIVLLNLGTSGDIFIHVPSALINYRHVQIESNVQYSVPGKELFPWTWDYREEGPSGWEHIAAIVSDSSVIPSEVIGRSDCESPIVCLTPEEINMLTNQLCNLSSDSWTSGVLSFLVG